MPLFRQYGGDLPPSHPCLLSMKAYATIALIASVLILFWSVLIFANIARFSSTEIVPILLVYAGLMVAYALATFFYVNKMERRRLTRRRS